jgi:hypothetical protein
LKALVVVAAAGIVFLSAMPADACPDRIFCSGWSALCKKNLPRGASIDECSRRYRECLSTGCFFFNNPRPRCKNNPEDLALTLSCQRSR